MEEELVGSDQNVQSIKPAGIHIPHLLKLLLGCLFVFILLLSFFLGTKYKENASRILPSSPVLTTSPVRSVVLPEEINNTALYYLKDKTMFKLSPLVSSPVIFLEKVDSYSFSPDKKKIAYIPEYGPDTDNNIYIKNLERDTVEITIKSNGMGVNRGVSWSPTGIYLIVDAGTGPEGVFTVYDSYTGRKLSSFGDGKEVWGDGGTLFITQRTRVDPYRPWQGGDGYSLAKIDVTSGKSEILLKADALTDYKVIKIKNSCLYYSRDHVDDANDWEDSSKINSENFCYDLISKASSKVSGSDLGTVDSLLKDKIRKIFPEYDVINRSEILESVVSSDHPEWVIMEIYNGESVYNSDILIFNMNDPRGTLQKLGTGAYISWF